MLLGFFSFPSTASEFRFRGDAILLGVVLLAGFLLYEKKNMEIWYGIEENLTIYSAESPIYNEPI